MGYLNNQIITVDAILTNKGRELLAKGDGSFNITQFALSDDEVDYTLYNPNHPSGSAYYGEAIQNMPLMEAFPDESQMMKYKLVSLNRGTSVMPTVGGVNAIKEKQLTPTTIIPKTSNYLGNVEGTSESTLSVATSSNISSSSMVSPTFLNHVIMAASVMLSPNLGILNSIFDII